MNDQHNDGSATQPNRKQPHWVIPNPYDPNKALLGVAMLLHGRPTAEELERRASIFAQGMTVDATENNLGSVFVDIPKNPTNTCKALLDAIEIVRNRVIGRANPGYESEKEEEDEEDGYAGLPHDDLAEGKERVGFMFKMDPNAETVPGIVEDLYSFIKRYPDEKEHLSKLEGENLPIEIFPGYTMIKANPEWGPEEYDDQYANAKPYENWAPCEARVLLEPTEGSEMMDLDD